MKILLVNEHQLLQNLLHIALEQKTEIEVIGEYLEGRTALRALSELSEEEKPDLVVQGIRLTDMDGLMLTEALTQSLPKAKILAVTGEPERRFLIPFLLLGGHGYLSHYGSDEEFFHAIASVMRGEVFLTEEGNEILQETCGRLLHIKGHTATHLALSDREKDVGVSEAKESGGSAGEAMIQGSGPSRQLSEREKQVFHLYVNGYRSSEIGAILYMSSNTVETHKKRIKEKLNMTRKAELTAYAKQVGLFEDWD